MRRPLATLVAAATLFGGSAAMQAPAANAVDPWQQTVDISFPAEADKVHFTDTYTACRSGCARTHQATDIMGPKMTKLFSTVDGVVCGIDDGEEDSYGRHITICGDDGNRYRYLHVNNDTPGTDDGNASLEHVYAPGIRHGVRVARGQHIAYMGDSGNAEWTASHLHFDVYVPGVVNPYGENRINPYHSLMAALGRNDLPDGTAVAVESNDRVSGPSRVETAIAVSRESFTTAPAAVVATSLRPHDALVGGPLAAVLEGPVLITPPDQLADAVVAELERLQVSAVYLVGDTSILAGAIGRVLPTVTAHAVDGGDVFTTSALVADMVWELTGATGAEHDHAHEEPTHAEPGHEEAGHEGHDEHLVTELTAPAIDFDPMAPEAATATLVVFEHGDRSGVVGDLHGAVLPGDTDRLYVSLAGVDPSEVDRVTFHVGEQARRSNRINTEKRFPYDLGGSGSGNSVAGVDHWWRTSGTQALTAAVRWRNGSTSVVTAVFEVAEAPSLGVPDVVGTPPAPEAPARRAILALGGGVEEHRSWPDALSASWYGSVRALPVLLTRPEDTPGVVASRIDTVDDLVVAGGPGAISAAQFDRLDAVTTNLARRLSGTDRYATAAAIAQDLVDQRLVDQSTVFVATGQNWPDAVAAGPAVANDRSLLLLVDGTGGMSESARTAFSMRADAVDNVVVLGGPKAVTDDTLRKVAGWAL